MSSTSKTIYIVADCILQRWLLLKLAFHTLGYSAAVPLFHHQVEVILYLLKSVWALQSP